MMTASLLLLTLLPAADPMADGWQREYTATEAKAAHMVALWQFTTGNELADSSGHGHTLSLFGAKTIAAGKFGGGLQSFPGWPVEDKRHAAVAKAHPSLSPEGAFTIDLWMKPAANLPERGIGHLLCKKYVSHHDYQLSISTLQGKARRLQLSLGFGADSEVFASDAVEWPTDVWQHIAVTYDGAGTVRFYRNGTTIGGRTVPGRKAISAGPLPLTIGDRTGSNYGGFAGVLDQVRISRGVREFSPASLKVSLDRSTYVRMEVEPTLRVRVRNLQPTPLQGAKVTLTGIGSAKRFEIPNLAPGAVHEIAVPFDTSLRPDAYELKTRVDIPGPIPTHREETLHVTLVGRPLPHRMPVMMWGIGSPAEFARELPRMKELGFTQCLGFGVDYEAIWKTGKPVVPNTPTGIAGTIAVKRMLDSALANDFGIAASLSPGGYLKRKSELARVDRKGKPYTRSDANASLPGLAEFCENVGKSVSLTHGSHPALVAALVNTEVRDDSEVSFSEHDFAAYRKFSGQEIPSTITNKRGFQWKSIKDFPKDRILADDDPRLRFLRWFWTDGDGWNSLHTALHRGLKSELPKGKDFYTWFDPAIRTASVPGSGGAVDVLGQWTYTEPSPLRLGYFTDELFAMADLSPHHQRVMKMTQLFWYRSTSAPIRTGANHIASPFDDHDADAAYISIAPMHLRGAFWTKISRPISGLMYHGWASLVPTDGTHAYKYTQPDLQTEFRRLHHEVLEPLGPTLLQVPARRSDVAYLDSFTSQMFAGRGSFGYANAEAYRTLLHAQLQPEVLFEDTILKRGLDDYKILVLADCDVLPASVAARIQAFQKRGGLIIGDPNLAPAIKPDLVLPKFTRTRKAAADKATILANAAELRKALGTRYQRPVEVTNLEIVPHLRSAGSSDYVFVVNDHREAGTYVGQHGLVLDVGLPSDGTLTLRRSNVHVYDLTARRVVSTTAGDGSTRWPVSLGPCDGNIFLVTERAIERVKIDTPEQTPLGKPLSCRITITDVENRPVDAVVPLRVTITDPHGRPAEFSGYYGTNKGQLDLKLDLASNDNPGVWSIAVQELASGLKTTRYFRALPMTAEKIGSGLGAVPRLPSLPDREGFAGSFSGVSNGALLVAGGANFPGKKPWEGGKKVWYDTVFALAKPDGHWTVAGKLPRPLGYGVSVTHNGGVVCVGGSDAEQHHADAFRLDWADGKLVTTKLPPLPMTLANGCGALVGDTLYVAGGQEKPDSTTTSKAAWRLDLSAREPRWERLTDCPGSGRMLAVAAGFDDSFWLIGGVDLVASASGKVERRYLTDAHRYTPGKGWQRVADLPRPVTAAPSPAPADASGLYLLGGDDGSQVGVAPDQHRGFSRQILRFDPQTAKWIDAGELAAPRVTVPVTQWGQSWVVSSGEARPGVRSPDVWAWTPGKKE